MTYKYCRSCKKEFVVEPQNKICPTCQKGLSLDLPNPRTSIFSFSRRESNSIKQITKWTKIGHSYMGNKIHSRQALIET